MCVELPMRSRIKWISFISFVNSSELIFPISGLIRRNLRCSILIYPLYLISSRLPGELCLGINLQEMNREEKVWIVKRQLQDNSSWFKPPKINLSIPKLSPSKRPVQKNNILENFTPNLSICPKTPNSQELTNKNLKQSCKHRSKNNENKCPETLRKQSSIQMMILKST